MPAVRGTEKDNSRTITYPRISARISAKKAKRAVKFTRVDQFPPPPLSPATPCRSISSSSATLVPDGQTPEFAANSESPKACAKNHSRCESITICGIELRPTVAFDTFWRFAAERKAIDDRRRTGQSAPWTDDEILQDYFFCNTYRVLDKGCQYLIKEVIEKGSQDHTEVVFRVVLFNLFTKISTWELLDRALGPLTWETYDREKYQDVLANALDNGLTLYTGAFIKPAPPFGFSQNYLNHLCFLETLMENGLAERLCSAKFLDDVYEFFIPFPSMGPFSTYQLMLCLSYTSALNFHENDFVISGPGSRSGLNKLFGKTIAQGRARVPRFDEEVMRYMAENQNHHFKRLGIQFSGLGPERLSMGIADIEHTLCEVDKYCRVAHPHLKGKRTNLHRYFTPSANSSSDGLATLPKAWALPARRIPRIRPERTLLVDRRYEVSHIVDHQESDNGRKFLVIWVGYPLSEATWEFEESLLDDAPACVAEYLSTKKDA